MAAEDADVNMEMSTQKSEKGNADTPNKIIPKDDMETPKKRPASGTPLTPTKRPAPATPKKGTTPMKPTPKPKGTMKKPGSKVMKTHIKKESREKDKPKLKPKANGKSSRSGKGASSPTWSKPLVKEADDTKESEEEENQEQDPEVNPGEIDFNPEQRKDRSKNKKFMLMLHGGGLPEFVTAEWQRTLTLKTGKLDAQRKLINTVFQKKDGKLQVRLDAPYVAQLKDHTQSKYYICIF